MSTSFRGCIFAGGVTAGLLAGCSSGPSRSYNTPPTAWPHEQAGLDLPVSDHVIVVGGFQNPRRASVRWRDIGAGVGQALSEALHQDAVFDVWANDRLAAQVDDALRGSPAERSLRLSELSGANPAVRYVVTGAVTDFHHTNDVPTGLRRRGEDEAVVAIRFTALDLRRQRIVLSDHVLGTAPTRGLTSRELYGDVAFGSYLFWNSPLGRATEEAVLLTKARVGSLLQEREQVLRVSRQLSLRKIALNLGSRDQVRPGDELFVVWSSREGMVPVVDPHARQPLKARILQVNDRSAVAWLLGRAPTTVDLQGACLMRALPAGGSGIAAAGAR